MGWGWGGIVVVLLQEALEHPYVAMFHNEAEEVNSSEQITIPLDDNTKYGSRPPFPPLRALGV